MEPSLFTYPPAQMAALPGVWLAVVQLIRGSTSTGIDLLTGCLVYTMFTNTRLLLIYTIVLLDIILGSALGPVMPQFV